MITFLKIFDWKTYILTMLAISAFSSFMITSFGETIPQIILTFFKTSRDCIVLAAGLIFAFTWFLRARPHNRPKNYKVIPIDVFGKKSEIDGIRTEFKTHDVAWSFMKQYKEEYPLHNFALVSDVKDSDKPTIYRYI